MTGDTEGLDPFLRIAVLNIESRLPEGMKLHVNSGVRDDPKSSHSDGLAVDLLADTSRLRYHIVRGALLEGFSRIGVYDQHIHLDLDLSRDHQVLWLGKSR